MKNKTRASFLALATFLLSLFTVSRAQGVIFGNTPTGSGVFDFVANGGFATGGAVAFTPSENFSFSSITVWLTGYTGLDMYGNQNQSFYAGVFTDQLTVQAGYTNDQPGSLLANLSTPSPNDGSLAAFAFGNLSPKTMLQAGTKYWLFIYENTSGSYNYYNYPQWVGGTEPVGNATFNGSASFGAFSFTSSTSTPAFTINVVPEPGMFTLLSLGLLAWGAFLLKKDRSTISKLAVQKLRSVHHSLHRK